MKKILYITIFFLLFISSNLFAQQTEICTSINDKIVLKNKKELVKSWEKRLKKEGFDVKITTIEMISTNNNQITIVGTNSDRTIKTAIAIIEKNGKYYQNTNIPNITCLGTSNGCYPELNEGNWICTPANVSATSNACTKITSIEIL